jgi:hypothetical protein
LAKRFAKRRKVGLLFDPAKLDGVDEQVFVFHVLQEGAGQIDGFL